MSILETRLNQIARDLPTAENADELIAEAAEILASDDYMSEFDSCDVTEWEDERNSRPFPF